MASRTTFADDGGTGGAAADIAAREKQRWTDKVYTRKSFKDLKNINTTNNSIDTLPGTTNNNDNENHFVSQLPSQNHAFDPANSNEKHPLSPIDAALEDASSLNPAQPAIPCSNDSNNHVVFQPLSENLVSKLVNSKEKHPVSCIDAALEKSANLNPAQHVVTSNGINNNQIVSESPSQNLVSKPVKCTEKHPISRNDAALGDSTSLNHAQPVVPSNGVMKQGTMNLENRIKINLASKSKQEMRDLKRNLENELNMVRSLVRRIEAKDGPVSTICTPAAKYRVDDGGSKKLHPNMFSIGVPRGSSRPSYHVSIPLIENGQSVNENLDREKRTPKANQFYRNSEFLLANDKFPPSENKKSKSGAKKSGSGKMEHSIGMGKKFYKGSSALLERLMKHKLGWVFIEPVDPKALGLVDYFTIIKHPMDLGTIKSRLNSNWYKSPYEFAEDVRLTFRNAMTYNPVGQDVHTMAGHLAKIFEDKWVDIEARYIRDLRYALDYDAGLPTPTSRRAYPSQPPFRPPFETRTLDRSESLSYHVSSNMKPMNIAPPTRTPAPKKPKAKDPDKRVMTFEEKQKLSTNLQSLPSEKLDNIVQIIKKRNSALSQNDDEIEVDIDSVDNETLWELDRFVTNYKKYLSKYKRRAELAHQAREAAKRNDQDKIPASVMAEKPQESKTVEKNTSLSSPFRGEKRGDNESSSSSSSSSSSGSDSSSSDSDSDSSSADGSDAEILRNT